MMIELLILGVIPIANNVALENAPPESVFIKESIVLDQSSGFITLLRAAVSKNGT